MIDAKLFWSNNCLKSQGSKHTYRATPHKKRAFYFNYASPKSELKNAIYLLTPDVSKLLRFALEGSLILT